MVPWVSTMSEHRAYALAVAELRGVVGSTGARADHLRTLGRAAFAPGARPVTVRDTFGPIHRRVPGTPVLRADDPTPDDLDVLLSGRPVPLARATATWRLVEGLLAGLAWSSTDVTDVDLPADLLAQTVLPVPQVDGRTLGWCSLEQAAAVPGLRNWLDGLDAWVGEAARVARPRPDVVVLGRP